MDSATMAMSLPLETWKDRSWWKKIYAVWSVRVDTDLKADNQTNKQTNKLIHTNRKSSYNSYRILLSR